MAKAARKGDSMEHGGALDGPGCSTVKIGGSNAWRVGDLHTCTVKNVPPTGGPPSVPHVGGFVQKGSFTVQIGGMPAARKGDIVVEPAAMPPTTPWLPKNEIQSGEDTVDIGDVAFGIMDPAILRRFCAEWRQLRQDWDGLDEAERQRRMEQMVNNALTAAGVPSVAGITATAPSTLNAAFNSCNTFAGAANTIVVPAGTFAGGVPARALGGILFHETRHVTQFFANARYLAGQGWNAAQIGASGMAPNVIQSAIANPATANSVAGQFGAMNHNQTYGQGAAFDRAARNHQTQAYSQGEQAYKNAIIAYYSLPNERDAEDAHDALKAICPDAQDPP